MALSEAKKKYRKSLKGKLQRVFNDVKARCNNFKHPFFYCYGGRGISVKFDSLDTFRSYVVDKMGITNFSQIKGLQLDRIDCNGNYEPGNIRFVTPSENMNNRRCSRGKHDKLMQTIS